MTTELVKLLERLETVISYAVPRCEGRTDLEQVLSEALALAHQLEMQRTGTAPHCETCICGKRARVQGSRYEIGADGYEDSKRLRKGNGVGPGTVAWAEHLLAWSAYAARYGSSQSAERMNERGGFGYTELILFLGHEPTTWEPRR